MKSKKKLVFLQTALALFCSGLVVGIVCPATRTGIVTSQEEKSLLLESLKGDRRLHKSKRREGIQ